MKFRFKKERLTPLRDEDIKNLGWIRLKQEEYNSIYPNRISYEKGNFYLIVDFSAETPLIIFIVKDATKLEWMPDSPEQFRVTLPCPSLEHFEAIQSLLI